MKRALLAFALLALILSACISISDRIPRDKLGQPWLESSRGLHIIEYAIGDHYVGGIRKVWIKAFTLEDGYGGICFLVLINEGDDLPLHIETVCP